MIEFVTTWLTYLGILCGLGMWLTGLLLPLDRLFRLADHPHSRRPVVPLLLILAYMAMYLTATYAAYTTLYP